MKDCLCLSHRQEPQKISHSPRRSEIPAQVAAPMDLTERNNAILEKCKQIVTSSYKEPRINGRFDDCTKEMLKGLKDHDSQTDEEVQSNTDSEI